MDPLSTLKQMQQLVATFANSIPSTLPGNPKGKKQGKPPMAYQSGGTRDGSEGRKGAEAGDGPKRRNRRRDGKQARKRQKDEKVQSEPMGQEERANILKGIWDKLKLIQPTATLEDAMSFANTTGMPFANDDDDDNDDLKHYIYNSQIDPDTGGERRIRSNIRQARPGGTAETAQTPHWRWRTWWIWTWHTTWTWWAWRRWRTWHTTTTIGRRVRQGRRTGTTNYF